MQNPDPCVQSTTHPASSLAALVHLSGIFTLFVGPLVVYLARGAGTDRIRDAAREALNFQITLLLAWIVTIISFIDRIPDGSNPRPGKYRHASMGSSE